MKTYLLALCGIIASISALGQGTITGTVTDKANGDILLGATIMIEPGGTGVMSDFDGNYTLSGLVPGTYTFIGRCIATFADGLLQLGQDIGHGVRFSRHQPNSSSN